jgi:hypothetical protein
VRRVLKVHGFLKEVPKVSRFKRRVGRRYPEPSHPNDVWQMDITEAVILNMGSFTSSMLRIVFRGMD